MSCQFVNATPSDMEYSAETKRSIRRQAMRDFRRRQRDEKKDLVSSPEPSDPSSIGSPEVSSQSQSRQGSRPRHSNSQSLSVQPEITQRHSSGTSSDHPPPAHRAGVTPSKRRGPQSPLESERSRCSHRRRRHNTEPRAQHGVFGQFMIDLPKRSTPPTIGEDIEALNSPGRLEQMLTVCDEYNCWLTSTTSSDSSERMERGAYDDKTSQMLVSALCLKSLGHLQAIRPSQATLEKNVLKTKILAILNGRLKNPSKALEDNTIGALACLASYEMSQGSSEATMHLSGLQQILNLRGGTRKIGHTAGLCMLLEILDLTHAVHFHTSATYTTADPSQPSSTEETPAPLSRLGAHGELDQAMMDDISNFILSIPDLAETREELPQKSSPQLTRVVTRNTFEDQVDAWHRLLAEAAQSFATSAGGGALAHVCRLAAEVHLLSTSAVQAHPARISYKTDDLFRAMSRLPDDAWDALPMLQTRILLTALSTTPSHLLKQKAWYYAHLTRSLYRVEAEDWPSVKGLVLRFIEMQSAARQPRPQAIRALAEGVGVEIVIDASEAEGRGMRLC